MRRFVLRLLGFAILATCLAAPAFAKRVALVIGNNAYTNVATLQKSVNDANAVAVALKDLRFDVLLGTDLTRRETNRKLADFEAEIAPGDQTFFFFAGHGVALGAENYLLATDMPQPRAGEESLVEDEGLAVNALVQRIQARGATASFFVLDACRDNPFAATGVRSIGGTRGLTRVEAPSGVFVLYSAGLGQSALDRLSDSDPDPNSVFTRKLVPLLETPGLSQVTIAKRVQEEVSALAATVRYQQQPAYYDQIIGEIVLKPAASSPDAGTSSPKPPQTDAARAWEVIQGTSSPAVLQAFVDRFPQSVFADFARARLSELGQAPPSAPQPAPGADETRAAIASDSSAASAPSADDERALVRSIQTALNRHGCDAGAVDGLWGAKSRRAVAAFAREAGLALDAVPSEALLAALDAHQATTCPAAQPSAAAPERKAAAEPAPEEPAQPSRQTYRNPTIAGLPVDICVSSFTQCHGEAADAFCRQKGFRGATSSKYVVYPETRFISGTGVCKPSGLVVCGGYSEIVCTR